MKDLQPEYSIGLIGHVDHGKCLAIDESILINNRLINGKDLVDLAKNKGRLVYKKRDEELYDVDDLYTYSLDNNLNAKRTKAQVFLQKYKGKLNLIETKMGREIKLTKTHPLLVNRNGKLIWLPSNQLKDGDYIAVLRNLNLLNLKKNIENKDYLNKLKEIYHILNRNDFLYIKRKTNNFRNLEVCDYKDLDLIRKLLMQSRRSFEKNCGINDWLLNCINNNKYNLSNKNKEKILNYLRKIKIIPLKKEEIIVGDKNTCKRQFVKFKEINIDENFIKFLAFFTAEGTSSSTRFQLCQRNYKEMRDEVLNYLTKLGLIYKKRSDKDFQYDYKPFIDYLRFKFGIKIGNSRNSGIPELLLNLSKEYKKLFLRWFFTFEAEANDKSGQINLFQANKNNINLLSYLLSEFGIISNLNKLEKCATNARLSRKRIYYCLSISGYKNLTLFLQNIGFNDYNKNKRINNYIKGLIQKRIGKRIFTPINVSKFNGFINEVFPDKKDRKWYNNIKEVEKKGVITDFFINELLRDSKNKSLSKKSKVFIDYLKLSMNGPIFYDKIKKISEINYNDYLVDLTVPQYHNFFGGYGGILCHNTTLVSRLSGKWTDTHSEEIKRGITIRLGYADATFFKCEKCGKYNVNEKCECNEKAKPLRKISFIDAPGHETLMATMLSGAAIIDGALLLISANEPCPQPQTREHLMALQIIGIKDIIIVQNKIDLVSEEEALGNYKQIKNFIKGTIAENAPIIPISAQQNVNIDVLVETIEKNFKTPKRDLNKDVRMFVARSFDINKPGSNWEELKGGVLGGALKCGKLSVNDEIEILPGIKEEVDKTNWIPIRTRIIGLQHGGNNVKEVSPGGSIGVLTSLDPSIVKSDSLAGCIVGHIGKMPNVFKDLRLKIKLLDRVVGMKEELKVENIKPAENLMLNVNSSVSVGIVDKIGKDEIHVILKRPIAADKSDRITISRMLGNRWRLIGVADIL